MSKIMNNESEFIFDEILSEGFTVVPNAILNDSRLTYTAIGVYASIIRYKNIPGWKVYQSTLINSKNGKSKIQSAVKELIEAGYIEKIQLRNDKGRMCGVKYIVHSKSIIPVENTDFSPKTDFPTSVFPTSENQPLKKKNNKKEKENKINTLKERKKEEKKDTQKVKKNYKGFDKIIDDYTENEDLKISIREFIKHLFSIGKKITDLQLEKLLLRLNNLAISENEKIEIINNSIANNWTSLQPLKKEIKNNQNNTTKDSKFFNFEQREYDYDYLEKVLLGEIEPDDREFCRNV